MERERGPAPGSGYHAPSIASFPPPSRVTRSAARQTAGAANSSDPQPPAPVPPLAPPPAAPTTTRKRKAAAREPSSPDTPQNAPGSSRGARSKRSRVEPAATPARGKKEKGKSTMSSAPSAPAEPSDEALPPPAQPASGRRGKSSRSGAGSSSRRTSKKSTAKPDDDTDMPDLRDDDHGEARHPDSAESDEGPAFGRYDDEDEDEDEDDMDDGDGYPHGVDDFAAQILGRSGLSLGAFGRVIQAQSSRYNALIDRLSSKDFDEQHTALSQLNEILLMANEDTVTPAFPTEKLVRGLVGFLKPNADGTEPPDVLMMLACQCMANLIEASPPATGSVVYGGAVPLLCARLLNIGYIEVAEQAISTLQKISVEFPEAIVQAGGLTACLTYMDFFSIAVQRNAVETAANCCRNLREESFSTVRDVMPILNNILNNSDAKVVEQGCICVSRIVKCFSHLDAKLEELVSTDLLRAILRLLLPGTSTLVGPNIHTMFLEVLAYTAKASPRLSAELFRMNVVDTLYQILTGVSPPSGTEDVATKIDTVVILQALIHRPREQVYETLNVICELLPNVCNEGLHYVGDLVDAGYPGEHHPPLAGRSKLANEKRVKLLRECKEEVKRFAIILLPTLTDVYSSTINSSVREKVLTAHLKMLSNLDVEILEEALRSVPYASFLASIFSQQEHPGLVTGALQAAELLLERLGHIYRYQFYREGVIAEISKLAERPFQVVADGSDSLKPAGSTEAAGQSGGSQGGRDHDDDHDDEPEEIEVEMHSDEEDYDGHDLDDEEHDSASDASDIHPPPALPRTLPTPDVQDLITRRAKKFMEVHETESAKPIREKAAQILTDLKSLAEKIKVSVLDKGSKDALQLFRSLAEYFDGDALESMTSYELMASGVAKILLEIFSAPASTAGIDPRSAFLEAFMGSSTANKIKTTTSTSPATPFSILVSKLQDLLSRTEHFDLRTPRYQSYEGRGGAASMLAKQLRLKLVADDDSGIPVHFRNIMVSIHAIATFKSLDDYLRPRLVLSDRPKRPRDPIAAYAEAMAKGRSPAHPPHTSSETKASSTPRKSKSKQPASSGEPQAGPSSTAQQKPRRSLRKQEAPPPPPPPPPPPELTRKKEEALECPDEQRISDDDSLDESALDDGALEAFMEGLQDDMDAMDAMDEDGPDPSAVNVEVASTGKVTARKEDGTRIATPVQGQTPTKGSSTDRQQAARSSLAALIGSAGLRQALGSSVGALSYAAAMQATPQDWHIEFSVNGERISNDTTIFKAVHFTLTEPSQIVHHPSFWSGVYTIKFRRVPGPPPAKSKSLTSAGGSAESDQTSMPASLEKHPQTADILRLLSILHCLNSNLDDVLSDSREQIKLNMEPLSQFVNTKLTAKLNRQLEEPLIVASECLPGWSHDLSRLYPFLFPFETRHQFLQSTSFGYSRSMRRWQDSQTTNGSARDRHRDDRMMFMGRLQRQKVRISRTRMLDSALKVLELYGESSSLLEVEYFEEVGTGLGPTLEFYATVSKEFSKKKLKMWRENDYVSDSEYAFGKQGLFPAPMSAQEAESESGKKLLHNFKMLGKFVARAMLDSRIIDVNFNPTFFRVGDSSAPVTPSLGSLRTVDADLAQSLSLLKRFANAKKAIEEDTKLDAAQKDHAIRNIGIEGARIDDIGLDFTLPGYPIDLVEDGAEKAVTIDNVDDYVRKVLDFTLGCGVQRQVDAFRAGFSEVFPYSALKAFTPDELVMIFGRVNEDWSLETLMDSIKADHGYNMDSKSVRNLLQVMSEYSQQERREFLQFITGSPKLPIGGFKSLTPLFTVVRKPSEPPLTSDDFLPSVMTCVNYLKMPDYSSIEVLREKLALAMKEGQGAFHLS